MWICLVGMSRGVLKDFNVEEIMKGGVGVDNSIMVWLMGYIDLGLVRIVYAGFE